MKKKDTELYPPIERLPKDINIPYKPDKGIDIGGLLQLFDSSDLGARPFDVKEELPKEFEV